MRTHSEAGLLVMKVCFFGTYDADQPRTRVLIEGLRRVDVVVLEHRHALWSGTTQKVGIARDPAALLGQMGRIVRAYSSLLGAARRLEPCDAVIYPHFGQLDLLATAWIFRRRGIPVIWDALISAFDTAAGDRRLVDVHSLGALGSAWLDRMAGRRADGVLVDTAQNAAFWRERFGIAPDKLHIVPVGAETLFALPDSQPCRSGDGAGAASFEVLFFGKYIPLHGVETILQAAAQLASHADIRITMIGTGQERPLADKLAAALDLRNVRFVDWIPYADLPATIAAAHACLGIFGTGDKAQRVVPNKAFQSLAVGRPLITADTPAARDALCRDGLTGAVLIPAGDATALATAILGLKDEPERCAALAHHGRALYHRFYRSELIGGQVVEIVRKVGGVADHGAGQAQRVRRRGGG